MTSARNLPFIGIPCCVRSLHERPFHTVADRYAQAVIDAAGCLPMLIPSIGGKIDCSALLDRLDGLLITGSPSNVEPHHYGGPPSREGTLHDPYRDATTLPLIREAVRRDMPILAICRGIQELNVALGGTLHQRIFEMPGRFNHRRRQGPMTMDQRYGPAHPVALTPGGVLARLAGDATEIMVNSLHGQGIDRPGPDLLVEAVAPDGQIEGVSLPVARFVIGVQWHPEYKALENPFSRALFGAFAQACHAIRAGAATNRRAA
jgi:putative glutamine amidotransferase